MKAGKNAKQLCKFVGNKSMLDETIDRLLEAGSKRVIITSEELLPAIEELLRQRNDNDLIEV